MTISDMDKSIYREWRSQGLTHEECMKRIPKRRRARFENSIKKSAIESHFGMTDKTFWIVNISFIVIFLLVLIAIIIE